MTGAVQNLPENAACLVDLGIRRDALAYRTLATLGTAAGPESVVVAADRRRAYVACSRGNTVGVYDLDRLAGIGEVRVGREPIAAVFDEPTGRLFTADARSDTVSVVDTARGPCGAVIAQVPVGAYPAGLAHDPARRLVLCGDTAGCTVSVIDCDTLERVAAVPAELGVGSIAVDERRGIAYAANFFARSVSRIDLDSLATVDRIDVGDGPCKVVIDATHDHAFVANRHPRRAHQRVRRRRRNRPRGGGLHAGAAARRGDQLARPADWHAELS